MGYQIEVDPRMFFKKTYCIKCGTILKVNKTKKVYRPGDPDFKRRYGYYHGHYYINYTKFVHIRYNYKCPNCGQETAYLQQVAYSKIQKKLNKKILTEEDLRNN